jgi:hypothetical protein
MNKTNKNKKLHDLTMCSSITPSEPAFNKTRMCHIPRLTHANYDEWKDDIILVLSAMRAHAIDTGDDPEP